MKLSQYLCAFLLSLSTSLHAQGDKPKWVSGDTEGEFPKSAFIIGIGQDSTQAKAADKARIEIAKAFSLSLAASSRSSAEETSNGKASSFSQTGSDDVRTSTKKVMDGVEVPHFWDDGQGTVYALAVLNREHSLHILKDKLETMDKFVGTLQEQLKKTEGKFARLKLALKLLKIGKSRRPLNENYRILNPEGKGIPAPAGLSDALAEARKAVSAIRIQVATTGESAEKTNSRIMDGLSTYGLKVLEANAGTPDILVEAKASAERLPEENLTWYWASGSILVKMSYGSTGEVFTRFEESGQDAARDPYSSVDVTLTSLSDKAADHVFKVITSDILLDD